MKISWHQNPFKTKVKIDDSDKERILLAHQNEEYSNILCDLNMDLNGKYNRKTLTDLEVIKEKVGKWGEICNLTVDSKEIQAYFDYLNTEHLGDCICIPCTCMRCWVEEMLGIDTLKGLYKHSASDVHGAFGKTGENSIDEALEQLKEPHTYETRHSAWEKYPREEYEKHIPRWDEERKYGLEWLQKYKEEHNF
jgi:hypothetical protein